MPESTARANIPDPDGSAEEQQNAAQDNLREEVLKLREPLDDIWDKLDPFKFLNDSGSILVTNEIVLKFRKEINTIIVFLRTRQQDIDELGIFKDTEAPCKKLDASMTKLNAALLSWGRSVSSGQNELQISEAQERYQVLLKDCRELLYAALEFFSVKKEGGNP